MLSPVELRKRNMFWASCSDVLEIPSIWRANTHVNSITNPKLSSFRKNRGIPRKLEKNRRVQLKPTLTDLTSPLRGGTTLRYEPYEPRRFATRHVGWRAVPGLAGAL